MYHSRTPLYDYHLSRLSTYILLKIAIFGILANFDAIFKGERVEIEKNWFQQVGKDNSWSPQISNQIYRIFIGSRDIPHLKNFTF